MANAYLASPSVGLLVALAITLQNLPEEFAMAVAAMTLRSRRRHGPVKVRALALSDPA